MANEKLEKWKQIVAADESAYEKEVTAMEERDRIFRGDNSISEIVKGDKTKETPHVRNVVAELIESQINSSIPQPKVTAMHKEDEWLAKLIEDMLRNKLDKLPFETINDLAERTSPVQGGTGYHVEWDNNTGTHTTVGESIISYRHPKQLLPQNGITSNIEDMDHFTLKIPQTIDYLKRHYDVDISDDGEDDSGLRTGDGKSEAAERMCTQYIVYSRNDDGGLDFYSWANDTELADIEDYQARHARVCKNCGAPEPLGQVYDNSENPSLDGTPPPMPDDADIIKQAVKGKKNRCPHCGGKFVDSPDDFITVAVPLQFEINDENITIPQGTVIPYYKPNVYPVVLQRNVSSFGKFLGDSDVDKIKNQQNSINRLYAKIMEQTIMGGSYIILPDDARIKTDSSEGKVIHISDPSKKQLIDTVTVQANISQPLKLIEQIYTEMQQLIGVTDSFLGRKDTTATSGKAKEISAAQAAGRLESKRIMKNAAYARIFETLFKFELAYADEVRPVSGQDMHGELKDEEWNKWYFLKQDDAGQYYWNDEFLFSVDSTAPLAMNREAMWQETRSHFESGAYGDPKEIETRILYWTIMEHLHYPGAGQAKKLLSEEQSKISNVGGSPNNGVPLTDNGMMIPNNGMLPPDNNIPLPDYGAGGMMNGGEML